MTVVVKDLVKFYRIGTIEIRALRGLNMSISEGEMVSLIGPSGSGKTTLLHLLVGTLQPDSGQVLTLGVEPGTQPRDLKAKIGYVPQHLALDPEMTGRETLSLFCTLNADALKNIAEHMNAVEIQRGEILFEEQKTSLPPLQKKGLDDILNNYPQVSITVLKGISKYFA